MNLINVLADFRQIDIPWFFQDIALLSINLSVYIVLKSLVQMRSLKINQHDYVPYIGFQCLNR